MKLKLIKINQVHVTLMALAARSLDHWFKDHCQPAMAVKSVTSQCEMGRGRIDRPG